MSFTSLGFYLCLFGAVSLYYFVPSSWRMRLLLLLSYAIYCTWSPLYLGLLILMATFAYAIGVRLSVSESEPERKALFLSSLLLPLGALVFFKCCPLVEGWRQIVVPIGISYYAFKLVSYCIEVYWDPAAVEKNYLHLSLYAAFFPQIVSGPIQRPQDFLTQVEERVFEKIDYEKVQSGLKLILGGLILKLVVADHLGEFVAKADASPETFSRLNLIFANYCYTLQIFADFAGFTNVAIGLGRLFGFDSPENFDAPFSASNIQEFWRRWHMTLTRWLTDYLFTPLRMATRHMGSFGLAFSIVVNMILIGLWHGIAWSFLIFGAIHAVFMVVSAFTLKARNRYFAKYPGLASMRRLIGIFVTFNMVAFAQLFFRAASANSALTQLRCILFGHGATAELFSLKASGILVPTCVATAIAFGYGFGLFRNLNRPSLAKLIPPDWALVAASLLIVALFSSSTGGQFIYFKF